uniref:Uncharacterized protein n=1 Tax=Chloropicon laureae TaxID=464258 RepID=A0A7S3E390_9CHLO|mmetsp:Transcript_279/g.615  ORF Transcript_279/g.615 Transcript_279/m.615 type:complete len:103 (+) Transcript_279:198-506(+)
MQRNVAANASMNYNHFARLLLMIAGERGKRLAGLGAAAAEEVPGSEADGGISIAALMPAYETKMAHTILSQLVDKVTDENVRGDIEQSMEELSAALPHVNFK